MYTTNNLYKIYKERSLHDQFSPALPDVTKKITLEHINFAINLCEYWNSCIDIGCGNGHYLAALSSKFKKCVGVEIDSFPEQKKLAEIYKNIEIVNKSIEEFETDMKFDFVLLSDIFEHIPNIENFVKKISGVQKIGGVVYILTPNPIFCGPASESEIFYTKTSYHGHIKHYTLQEVKNIMQKEGYKSEFHLYEETEKRQTIKNIAKGFSRRDKVWSSLFMYKLIRPFALLILKPLYCILGKYSYYIEQKNSNYPFATRAIAITFKKYC